MTPDDDAIEAIRARVPWRTLDWLRKALRLYVERGMPTEAESDDCPARDLHAIADDLGAPPDQVRAERERDALQAALDERDRELAEARAETAEIAAALGMPGRAAADVAQGARNLLAAARHYECAIDEAIDALGESGSPGSSLAQAIGEVLVERDTARRKAQRERERAEAAEWLRHEQAQTRREAIRRERDTARREAIEEAIGVVHEARDGWRMAWRLRPEECGSWCDAIDAAEWRLRALLTREAPSTDEGTAGG